MSNVFYEYKCFAIDSLHRLVLRLGRQRVPRLAAQTPTSTVGTALLEDLSREYYGDVSMPPLLDMGCY